MDKVYKNQLEAFGIESQFAAEESPKRKNPEETTQETLNVVRALMDAPDGRQWLHSKLAFCGVFATPFIPGKPDSSAFLCGMQEIGHHIQREMMLAAPENYFLMLQEEAARKMNSAAANPGEFVPNWGNKA